VPRGDVGGRAGVERVDAAQQPEVKHGEFVPLRLARGGEVGDVLVRHHVRLDRPARGERHERGPVLAGQQHARPCLLELENVGEERRTVVIELREQLPGARRDVRVTVDLAVRVLQGDADLGAAVLEDVHLPHAGQ
jgi:hypothetical protein